MAVSNLYSQSDTSGWVQSGNVLFQRMQIDSITQFGLSSTGDTVWTYSRDNTLRFWDVEDGKLIYEKQFDTVRVISKDLKTCIKMDYVDLMRIRFSIYDLLNDNLLYQSKGFGVNANQWEFLQIKVDYVLIRNQLYFASHINSFLHPKSYSSIKELNIFTFEDFSQMTLLQKYFIYESDFVINEDRSRFLITNLTKYENKDIFRIFQIALDDFTVKVIKIHETGTGVFEEPYTEYKKLSFTGIDGPIAAINNDGELVIISDETTKTLNKYNLKHINYTDYCFSNKNQYLILSGKNVYIYDFETKRCIDSLNDNPYNHISHINYSKSLNKVLFATKDKFGIFNSKFLANEPSVAFVADSNYVYIGESLNLYNKSNFEYETIEWELSDGRKSFHPNPTFTFDTPGFYDVRLRLFKDGKSYEELANNFIEVLGALKPSFSSDFTSGDAPLSVRFFCNSSGEILSRTWLVNEKVFSNEMNPTYIFTNTGRYHISLIITDKYRKDTLTKYYYISVGKSKVEPLILKGAVYTYAGQFYDDYLKYYRDRWIQPIGTQVVKDSIYSFFASHGVQTFANHLLKFDTNMNLKMNTNTLIYKDLQHYRFSNLISFNDTLLIHHIMSRGLRKINPISGIENFVNNGSINLLYPPSSLVRFDNNSVLVGGLYYRGLGNYINSKIVISDMNGSIVRHDSIIEKFIELIKFSDELIFVIAKSNDNKFLLFKYTSQLELIERYDLDLPSDINIKSILKIPNSLIAFCGEQTTGTIGIIGVLNANGKVIWMKEMPDWKVLHRLYNNRNTIFAIGTVRSNGTGFIEIDGSGTHFTDNRFTATNPHTVFDLDVLSKNELILTFFGSSIWVVNKVQYKPLDQPPEIVDTINTTGVVSQTKRPQNIILPVPNPANNTISLQFADMQTVHSVIVYDYSGIEVMRIDYPVSPIFEVTLPIHSLSIGIYHATVTTASGILRTRFIKY